MRKLKKLGWEILLVSLVVLFCSASISSAGSNTHSIPVSCSIPEVPGLNAPLIEEESSRSFKLEEEDRGNRQEIASFEEPYLLEQETGHNLRTYYAR